MSSYPLQVPEAVTFEQAIALTHALLSQVEAGELSQPEVAALVTELVKAKAGARGFFVTSLTSEVSIVDNPSTLVVQALRSRPEVVVDLLVKNLAMSAVQAVVHRQNQKEEMALGSEQVPSAYSPSNQLAGTSCCVRAIAETIRNYDYRRGRVQSLFGTLGLQYRTTTHNSPGSAAGIIW